MFFLETVSALLSTDKRVTFQEPENTTCIPSTELRDEALQETVTVTPHMLLLSQIHPTILIKTTLKCC